MTVAELIKKLRTNPPDLEVGVSGKDGHVYGVEVAGSLLIPDSGSIFFLIHPGFSRQLPGCSKPRGVYGDEDDFYRD